MKKLILSFLLLSFIALGCGNKKEKQKEVSEIKETSSEAIEKIEEEAESIEVTVDSIKASAEKLDNLLNELE